MGSSGWQISAVQAQGRRAARRSAAAGSHPKEAAGGAEPPACRITSSWSRCRAQRQESVPERADRPEWSDRRRPVRRGPCAQRPPGVTTRRPGETDVAVKLRLMRMGKTKQPTYRVVAADSRSPRDGRFIEILGVYAAPGPIDSRPRCRRRDQQREGAQVAAPGRPAYRPRGAAPEGNQERGTSSARPKSGGRAPVSAAKSVADRTRGAEASGVLPALAQRAGPAESGGESAADAERCK